MHATYIILWWILCQKFTDSSASTTRRRYLIFNTNHKAYPTPCTHHSRNYSLTKIYWGRVTYICVSKLTIIGSDSGLSPGRRQAIIWTNAGILLIGTLGTNFSEILSKIHIFSFKKIHFKMPSGKGGHFVSASMSKGCSHRQDIIMCNTDSFGGFLFSFMVIFNYLYCFSIEMIYKWYVM